MKQLLILGLLLTSIAGKATTYYVATNGNDGATGTLESPWLTWQHGFSAIGAGDILYIRGGTYYPTATAFSLWGTNSVGVGINGHNGTTSNRVTVMAYPGETPVLDCTNIVSSSTLGIVLVNCNYWHLKGLEVKHANQVPGGGAAGVWLHSCNHCTLEQLTIHHNGGSGLRVLENSEDNLILNCDSFSNYDPYRKVPGDDADGFEIANIPYRAGNPRINTLLGCRAWYNSDDGVDLYRNDGTMIIDSCWVWRTGYITGTSTPVGDGNGLKLGKTILTDGAQFQRIVKNCVVFSNRRNGLEQNGANVRMYIYNNTVYDNQSGIVFYSYDLAHVFRNNASFLNIGDNYYGAHTHAVIDHNTYDRSWQPVGPVATAADFVSVDPAGMSGPRQADGSLPVLKFMKLAPSSGLIDVGVDVGIPYKGTAPDLGAFEYLPVAPPPGSKGQASK